MQTDSDPDAAFIPHAGPAARLRDLTLALFWSDAAAGVRGCRRLARRATRAGMPLRQARLRATHRLLAGMVIVTLTWLLGHHHRCMRRALEAFTAADDTVLR